ncbi:MAG: HlyD family efflux transporter periplasmic adaptor subunit [Desulfobacter sp.]|nr:MAG: HlyD family efflux transporter periplasmic adaptor subunit [Desulfobacter sp.]
MRSFLFRLMRVVIVLALAFGFGFWLFAVREKPKKKQKIQTPPKVVVIKATSRSEAVTIEAFGTIIPRKKVKLALEVGGRIDYLHPLFRDGGAIGKGELILRIDQRSLILDKTAAQVRVDIRHLTQDVENLKADAGLAKTNMDLSLKELARVKALSKNQFASKTSLDKAQQQYLAARIQLQNIENRLALTPSVLAQKKAALAMARADFQKVSLVLEKSQIRSGFDGLVLVKQVEMGEFVNPGQVLGSIYEKGAMDVDVSIPLEELKWLRACFEEGRLPKAQVSVANLEGPDLPVWQAKLVRVKANIDEKTRTLPLTLEIGDRNPLAKEMDPAPKIGQVHKAGQAHDSVQANDSVQAGEKEIPKSSRETAGPEHSITAFALLKPGTFVTCRIQGEIQDDIFRLPRHLMRSSDALYLVEDGRLRIRKVLVLRKFEDQVIIDQGLVPGDLIVSSPLPGAVEGMALTVKTLGEQP